MGDYDEQEHNQKKQYVTQPGSRSCHIAEDVDGFWKDCQDEKTYSQKKEEP